MGPHYAVTEEGSQKGADVSTTVAVVNHFQHFLRNASAWCTEELPADKVSTEGTKGLHSRLATCQINPWYTKELPADKVSWCARNGGGGSLADWQHAKSIPSARRGCQHA